MTTWIHVGFKRHCLHAGGYHTFFFLLDTDVFPCCNVPLRLKQLLCFQLLLFVATKCYSGGSRVSYSPESHHATTDRHAFMQHLVHVATDVCPFLGASGLAKKNLHSCVIFFFSCLINKLYFDPQCGSLDV